MDFLQASIDAALKSDSTFNVSTTEENNDFNFDDSNFNFDDSYFPESSGENNEISDTDDQPPVLEEPILDDEQNLNGDDTTGPPTINRSYQEDIIPLEKCTLNGNRLSIEGCKYTFVRLNVRNNIYFRCVNCYGIYQKRRTMVSKSGYTVEVPSVGSLKLVPTGNGEIRGNPDKPSGIPHCCESEKFKETIKETPISRNINNKSLDPLTSLFNKNGNNTNGNDSFDAFSLLNKLSTPSTPVGTGPDDDIIIPGDKCKFTGKRLEIEGCKYTFSRTQSGPRDYYRCCACIALYHKRHFRKLPTPKIGSLSLIRESGILTGNPELPRGLPHICDNIELQCAPIRADYKPKIPTSTTQISQLSSLLEDVKKSFNLQQQNGGIKAINGNKLPDDITSLFQSELNKINKRVLNDNSGPQSKFRKIVEDVMGPVATIPKLNVKSYSPSNINSKDEDIESLYPHTNDLQMPPKRLLPDQDLSHIKRSTALNSCYAQFPKLPNQGRVIILSDSLLTEFQSKTLNPSTSIVRAEFPVTPTHLLSLCLKAKYEHDCFSKTKHVFFVLGYDVMRCMDLDTLERKINLIQNEFLELRQFLDQESTERGIMLTYITVPEIGLLATDLKALNSCMKRLIDGLGRDDVQICDWAQEYSMNPTKYSLVEDRISSLMKRMTQLCGVELLDED